MVDDKNLTLYLEEFVGAVLPDVGGEGAAVLAPLAGPHGLDQTLHQLTPDKNGTYSGELIVLNSRSMRGRSQDWFVC